jgi:methionine synthase II (cobalamin-independent)
MTVVDSSSNEFYRDEAELAFDVAAALNAELKEMQAAGCDVIPIAEPAMPRYHEQMIVDALVKKLKDEHGEAPEKARPPAAPRPGDAPRNTSTSIPRCCRN